MSEERVWPTLSPAQAHGWACVMCGRDYIRQRPGRHVARVPVGRSKTTGSPVYACAAGGCEERARARGFAGSDLVIGDPAMTAAAMAFLSAWDTATAATPGGDPRHADPDPIVVATLSAAAPFLVAAELRWLADVFQREADMMPPAPQGSDAEDVAARCERYQVLLECAAVARGRAFGMDPAGGAS